MPATSNRGMLTVCPTGFDSTPVGHRASIDQRHVFRSHQFCAVTERCCGKAPEGEFEEG
jgi:hypothetical protein